ncbi:lipoyl amidotransferase LIPT1, mitochondrial isoform X2 [Prorops nasuta]|uniref:lipoyl amidotransferase LIPT1, mitochondrial isoform X2 n=1 Tax=Prorops nasuta TaxID=863751 RepID=UPI0034CDFEA7
MSLIGRNTLRRSFFANFKIASALRVRNESTGTNESEPIRKSVFISQSTDVFTNLALEDWFYRNFDLSKHHVLMLWRNDPCVVIGRHQNPWLESNVQEVENRGISLARRNSGGGTVYHDAGNLNLSFFTPRDRYNRRYNLDIICRALYREYGLTTTVNKREDIVVEGDYKVSGTAAKLGRPNAYHHCTLLVDVNKSDLSTALSRKDENISTKATASIRSPIKNLRDINSQINVNGLLNALGWEFLRTKALVLEDGGHELIQQQKGFQMISPSEDWFPGIEKIKQELRSWDWTFGKTPEFTVTRLLNVPAINGVIYQLNLTLEVVNGVVKEIKMSLPAGLAPSDFKQDASVITNLQGRRYDHEITENIVAAIGCKTVAINSTPSKANMVATQ